MELFHLHCSAELPNPQKQIFVGVWVCSSLVGGEDGGKKSILQTPASTCRIPLVENRCLNYQMNRSRELKVAQNVTPLAILAELFFGFSVTERTRPCLLKEWQSASAWG